MRRVMVAVCIPAALAGCNTIEGVGRDIQVIGRAITGAAADAELDGGPGSTGRASIAGCSTTGAVRNGGDDRCRTAAR